MLIGGMLPFALALQRTGGIDLAASALLDVMGDASPGAVLAGLLVVTAGLGLFIANTATAVLMAPVALALAQGLQASPYSFAMIVALFLRDDRGARRIVRLDDPGLIAGEHPGRTRQLHLH